MATETTKRGSAEYVESGEFDRDTDYVTTRITEDSRDGHPVEPGRYRLVVARACNDVPRLSTSTIAGTVRRGHRRA